MSYWKSIVFGGLLGFYLGEKNLPFPILYKPARDIKYDNITPQFKKRENDVFGVIIVDFGVPNQLIRDLQAYFDNLKN